MKHKNSFKMLLGLLALMTGILACGVCASAAAAAAKDPGEKYIVVLDPGHGGIDGGAWETYGGVEYVESDINLKIAKYCYQLLSKEENLKVYMTRTKDVYVGVNDRVKFAEAKRADLLVSFHINSAGEVNSRIGGCMVLLSQGLYRPYIARKEEILTDFILKNLNGAGIELSSISDRGRYYRLSEEGNTYPNGAARDYYGIVAGSVEAGFPGVIIEHAFVTNPLDCSRHFSSKTKLKRIGQADAKAIISYFKSEAASVDYAREETRDPEWVRSGGKYYYRLSDGSYLKNSWLVLNGKRYYLKADGSRAERFCRINKQYYYFRPEGYAATGRYKVNSSYYLFTGKGKMIAKGWYTSSKGRHYYTYPIKHAKKGRLLVSGKYIINGKVYRFNAIGVCTNYATAVEATEEQRATLETIA